MAHVHLTMSESEQLLLVVLYTQRVVPTNKNQLLTHQMSGFSLLHVQHELSKIENVTRLRSSHLHNVMQNKPTLMKCHSLVYVFCSTEI